MKLKADTVNALTAPLLAAMMATIPARANDTAAALGVGGLEFKTSEDIVMASEDLYLSPSQVRVRYTFRNESDRNITTRVAFPLPDIDPNAEPMILLPRYDQENFVDFQVTIDGQPVQPDLEQKAIAEGGADVTTAITRAGLPINASLSGLQDKVSVLPGDVRRQLVDKRLLTAESGDPKWSLRATFHWEQTFPAGKTIVVEHRYKPIAGAIPLDEAQNLGPYRFDKTVCLDKQGMTGIRRLQRQQAAAEASSGKSKGDGPARLYAKDVKYILTTGANWKGPIGDFTLTIDKEKPDSVLSLCIDGIKRAGPTTFQVKRTNFTPKKDIRFVVFGLSGGG